MQQRTASMRATRAIALLILSAAAITTTAGIASAAYPGLDRAGGIHACFNSSTVRIVDHFPCKTSETALSWNAQGRAGTDGSAGLPGVDGKNGPVGAAGSAGAPGIAGKDGSAGHDGQPGAPGVAGVAGAVGPAGHDGTNGLPGPAGPQGATGATGPQGPAGPAGPSATGGGGATLMSGRILNNTDPDCAMTAAMGHTTAGACSMTPLKALGDMLAAPATLSAFTAVFDRAQSGGHIYAITIDPSTARAVDVLLLCTIPAGTATCDQTGPINLTGRTLLGLEFDGDRSWTSVTFGYELSPR